MTGSTAFEISGAGQAGDHATERLLRPSLRDSRDRSVFAVTSLQSESKESRATIPSLCFLDFLRQSSVQIHHTLELSNRVRTPRWRISV
jgi:hypothetical protein